MNVVSQLMLIDELITESNINVAESMIESYERAFMILDNYQGDDLSSFSLFTESVILEADDSVESSKQSLLAKLWNAIVSIFKTVSSNIDKVFSETNTKQCRKNAKLIKEENQTNPEAINFANYLVTALQSKTVEEVMREMTARITAENRKIEKRDKTKKAIGAGITLGALFGGGAYAAHVTGADKQIMDTATDLFNKGVSVVNKKKDEVIDKGKEYVDQQIKHAKDDIAETTSQAIDKGIEDIKKELTNLMKDLQNALDAAKGACADTFKTIKSAVRGSELENILTDENINILVKKISIEDGNVYLPFELVDIVNFVGKHANVENKQYSDEEIEKSLKNVRSLDDCNIPICQIMTHYFKMIDQFSQDFSSVSDSEKETLVGKIGMKQESAVYYSEANDILWTDMRKEISSEVGCTEDEVQKMLNAIKTHYKKQGKDFIEHMKNNPDHGKQILVDQLRKKLNNTTAPALVGKGTSAVSTVNDKTLKDNGPQSVLGKGFKAFSDAIGNAIESSETTKKIAEPIQKLKKDLTIKIFNMKYRSYLENFQQKFVDYANDPEKKDIINIDEYVNNRDKISKFLKSHMNANKGFLSKTKKTAETYGIPNNEVSNVNEFFTNVQWVYRFELGISKLLKAIDTLIDKFSKVSKYGTTEVIVTN